ncbi:MULTISPECIES: PTS system mannose/fructose/N-acetylgalactosamine-transporter subunit IIB [Lactobacillaceae]|uniref:PTS system mannose/fructose/N-acetylgalactosamine-transporter subunit IIB n=1 Tax=Lactobacillaceae TaxID=33958 RepID=UPI00189B654F|nr:MULTISPECIES: PTS sugar transporter subunit IIB [Lactobacillaceae]MDV7758744.1 PTS mannose/fructose/sorbose transporter subunit IIB [Liquorilactobacillus mali]
MSVVMARIDNRLLHGIIVTQWAPQSGSNRVMVIDDETANNPVAKSTMKMARPTGNAISIITKEKALNNFDNGKYDSEKVLILSKTPDVFLELINKGVEINKINVGGTIVKENAIQISKRAYATSQEVETYEKLLDAGVELVTQYVPADKEIELTKETLEGKGE